MKFNYLFQALQSITLIAALSVFLMCFASTAQAQGDRHGNHGGGGQHMSYAGSGGHGWGGGHQGGGESWGYNQAEYRHHHHHWGAYPYYNGPEHRRYYSYNGNEFYINLDTGIRIEL